MDLLKFVIVGSVDDGKSTLLGRLLLDSGSLCDDQIRDLKSISLAHITDGLRSEREQGITMDIAYRYFSTLGRRFVVIDAPGHFEYISKMITGATQANCGVVVVDVERGIQSQTKKHLWLLALLGIDDLIFCINKMDAVQYSQSRFKELAEQLTLLLNTLDIRHVSFIPVAAIYGDNIVFKSANSHWYNGAPLLKTLQDIKSTPPVFETRVLIQNKIENVHYAHVIDGSLLPSNEYIALPSKKRIVIHSIRNHKHILKSASKGEAVTLSINTNLDRGDLLVPLKNKIRHSKRLDAIIIWFSHTPLKAGIDVTLQRMASTQPATIEHVHTKFDLEVFGKQIATDKLEINDTGIVTIMSSNDIYFDDYQNCKKMGAGTITDRNNGKVLGAFLLKGNV